MTSVHLPEYKEALGTCAECGNSPVNHTEHYVSTTLAIWMSDAFLKRTTPLGHLTVYLNTIFDRIEEAIMRVLAAMPFSTFAHDIEHAATYRSRVVWEEARRRGLVMEQLRIFKRGTEVYRVLLGGTWRYFQSLPIPRNKRGESALWLDDKHRLKQYLTKIGVASPREISVSTVHDARKALQEVGGLGVVKPRSGSRGRHTTVYVQNDAEVEQAFISARKLCKYVVVEEYIDGPVCRATLVEGRLVGFFRAYPPIIVGDGISNIRDLVEKLNNRLPERVQRIHFTDEHRNFLARHGYNEDSVLKKDASLSLTHRTGRLFGGITREMLGFEHPKLRTYVEKAARDLGIGVVGFDLIIPDPEKDPDEQRWGIIEANTLPYIDLHYLTLEGRPSNVASHIWNMWDEHIHSHGVDVNEARGRMHV